MCHLLLVRPVVERDHSPGRISLISLSIASYAFDDKGSLASESQTCLRGYLAAINNTDAQSRYMMLCKEVIDKFIKILVEEVSGFWHRVWSI